MQDFKRGTVRANQLTFEYLTEGDGPLALCIHGFPDSPYSYRYLLTALAEAGYRAVAPWTRSFRPSPGYGRARQCSREEPLKRAR